MLNDVVPRQPTEKTYYELVFRLEDCQGSAFAFECDEHGHVYLGRLPELARHCLALCRKGEVDGFRVRPGVVRFSTQSYNEPGSGRCGCGQRVILDNIWDNACGNCGQAYDGDGVELADRSMWGEGTGESLPDNQLDVDPERYR